MNKNITGVIARIMLFLALLSVVIFCVAHVIVNFDRGIGKGDESYYISEAIFTQHTGFYNALSQGTSIGYSALLIAFKSVSGLSWAMSGRILGVVSTLLFVTVAWLLYKKVNSKFSIHSGILVIIIALHFSAPMTGTGAYTDMFAAAGVLWALIYLIPSSSYKSLMIGGGILVLSYTFRPTVLFIIIAIAIVLFFKNKVPFRNRVKRVLIFSITIALVLAPLLLPSIIAYGQPRFENKNYLLNKDLMIKYERFPTWFQLNTYYELYKDKHGKSTKWNVTFEEVADFLEENSSDALPANKSELLQEHGNLYLKNGLTKSFIFYPYILASQTPIYLWISVTSPFIKLDFATYTFVMAIFFWVLLFFLRKFLKKTDKWWLLIMPFLYVILISLYSIAQLEINWLFVPVVLFSILVVQIINSIKLPQVKQTIYVFFAVYFVLLSVRYLPLN